MSWACEEYCEDAVVAYLNAELAANLLAVYPAWSDVEIEYPCAVVHAGVSRNATENGFTGHREIDVSIGIMCEAKAVGADSARELNRKYRNAVMETFAQTALQDDLNALVPLGVVFSLAYVTEVTRNVESDMRLLVSEITLKTIVSPKELV